MSQDMNNPTARKRRRRRGRRVDSEALHAIRELLGDAPRERDQLLEHLHRIQDHHGCLPAASLVALADELRLAPVEVFEVASFYHHFNPRTDPDEEPAPRPGVRICDAIGCQMHGANPLIDALTRTLGERLDIQRVPCVGQCAQAPVAVLGTRVIGHADVAAVESALTDGNNEARPPPDAIDYRRALDGGGYALLRDCLAGGHARQRIIDIIDQAGLRGLGGAGFPTARKWRILRDQPGPRVLVVNADEGEPGTFKDRHCLEHDPHRFLEGALIAAWVIEADSLYIYLRDEYASARILLERELKALRDDPPASLPTIHLRRGAGAYICGEESALLESIEGKRGMPRQRPPYVAEVGLFGRPTLVQNLETLYRIREIVDNGADWYHAQGRRGRHGARAFSVSGRVRKPGVYLAPVGISARELIDEYCGGMADGHRLYGYFPGGASGGMLPASLADLPLDFDTLREYGCFIGSAAVIVFSQQDSARELALNAMRFFAAESCGQCTPCRVGTTKAAGLMAEADWDIPRLEDLASVMEDASICGLGQAAPNPLRCVLRYFPGEFDG